MDAKNVVQVQICGHTYTIKGEADQGYILDVAAYVDRKMREVMDKLPVASPSKVAILAALNIAHELFNERNQRQAEDQHVSARTRDLHAALDEMLSDSRES